MTMHGYKNRADNLIEALILTISVVVTSSMLIWVLWYSRYGFDFTDESYYLIWMSNPFNYKESVSQFGFIYHPLFNLFNGNVANLRQANILITFILAWVLVYIFLKMVFGGKPVQSKVRLITSAAIATASLTYLIFAGLWLATPSYNSLAFQSLFIAAIGLLLAEKSTNYVSISGWLMLGLGGWLAFMAKPTTAAGLGVCTFFYILITDKINLRLLAISIFTAIGLFLVSAFVIDGSAGVFIDRIRGGLEIAGVLNPTPFSQVIRLDTLELGSLLKLFFILYTALIFFSANLFKSKKKVSLYLGTALVISWAGASLAIMLGFINISLVSGRFQSLLLSSVAIAAVLIGFKSHGFLGALHATRSQWALSLTFLVFPYVYALGTGNNYWILIGSAGIFIILAGLIFLIPISSEKNLAKLLITVCFSVQFIVVVLVKNGLERPYRQPQPLHTNNYEVALRNQGNNLILSAEFGRYIEQAVEILEKSGFKKGMSIIDMTGKSPGLLYALGANIMGQAWLMGGYPGSNAFAISVLKKVKCHDLASAWLLSEPIGPLKLSPDILLSFGAKKASDFKIVGTLKTASGASGNKDSQIQQLLKPTRPLDIAIAECEDARVGI